MFDVMNEDSIPPCAVATSESVDSLIRNGVGIYYKLFLSTYYVSVPFLFKLSD